MQLLATLSSTDDDNDYLRIAQICSISSQEYEVTRS
jgi:hypothetical protein